MSRETPCPWRIVDDMGGAFAMGAIGGGLWHSVKGFRNSPRGSRIPGMIHQVKLRSPVLGGNFAVWGGLFSTYDCMLVRLRRKEDPWNAVAAGGLTGATLAVRAGARAMVKNGVVGAVLLAMIEGLGVMVGKYMEGQEQPPLTPYGMQAPSPIAPPVEQMLEMREEHELNDNASFLSPDDHSFEEEDDSFSWDTSTRPGEEFQHDFEEELSFDDFSFDDSESLE